MFPSQQEILDYLRRVALRHKIPERLRLQTEWKGARWSEKTSRWLVTLEDLQTGTTFVHEAKILISAVGGYTNPKYPSLPGIETFKGPVVHTAKWDQDYDLHGRRVVVVGNGCKLTSHREGKLANTVQVLPLKLFLLLSIMFQMLLNSSE